VNPIHPTEPSTLPPAREQFIELAMADYESPLIAYAATILNDPDLARDVVQDTFIRLCQQDPAKVREHLKSWLFTVCRNRALDLLRKNQHTQTIAENRWLNIPAPGFQPDARAETEDRLARLMKLLTRLSPNQRDVILLKFQQGLSYQEIHDVTGLSSGNIGFLIHTGLKHLRSLLR